MGYVVSTTSPLIPVAGINLNFRDGYNQILASVKHHKIVLDNKKSLINACVRFETLGCFVGQGVKPMYRLHFLVWEESSRNALWVL